MSRKARDFGIGCGLASVILGGLLLIFSLSCKPVPSEAQVQVAMENLWVKSPEDNRKLHAIPVPITWKMGDLKGTTLASTIVYADRIEITFDWMEIKAKNERLEPIIAHEISHAYDAFNTYGIEEFFRLVAEERGLAWADRTVEKSAIQQENQTRQYLIKNYPAEFKNMSPSRRT
ncbi:MAG: hypothetical protein WCQ50_16135 [Spirochaetota bacterium]